MSEPRTISIPRSGRYFLAGDTSADVNDVWFLMHGYGQLADEFLSEVTELAGDSAGEALLRTGRILVSVEGLSRFYLRAGSGRVGASWMTKVARDDEIDDYVRYLDAVYGEVLGAVSPADVRVSALGFSQGGATAWRWALLGCSRVDRLISWAGGVPPDLDLAAHKARLERLDVTLVAGTRDELIDEGRLARESERLNAALLSHRVVRFDGAHRLDRETLARLIGEG